MLRWYFGIWKQNSPANDGVPLRGYNLQESFNGMFGVLVVCFITFTTFEGHSVVFIGFELNFFPGIRLNHSFEKKTH